MVYQPRWGHVLVAGAARNRPRTQDSDHPGIMARHTLQRPTEDRFLMTRVTDPEQDRRTVGGAAEKLVFGELLPGRRTILASHRHRPRHDHPLWHGRGLGYIAFEAQRPRGPRYTGTGLAAVAGWPNRPGRASSGYPRHRDGRVGARHRILDIKRAVLERCARKLLRGKRSTKAISVN